MKIEMTPLSLTETKELAETIKEEKEEESKELGSFLKKFTKLSCEKAEEMKKELKGLNFAKLKDEHLVKITDLLPESIAEINKIFVDVSLDENEINKLLEIVKKYK